MLCEVEAKWVCYGHGVTHAPLANQFRLSIAKHTQGARGYMCLCGRHMHCNPRDPKSCGSNPASPCAQELALGTPLLKYLIVRRPCAPPLRLAGALGILCSTPWSDATDLFRPPKLSGTGWLVSIGAGERPGRLQGAVRGPTPTLSRRRQVGFRSSCAVRERPIGVLTDDGVSVCAEFCFF